MGLILLFIFALLVFGFVAFVFQKAHSEGSPPPPIPWPIHVSPPNPGNQ